MIFYHKMTKVKKALLSVLFLIICITQRSFASQINYVELGLFNMPSICLCLGKAVFNYNSQVPDFITHGPNIITQALMISSHLHITYKLLLNKSNLLNGAKKNENENLTKIKNFPRIIFITGLAEVVLFYALQSGVLWYQQKINGKTIAYAGCYSLIQVIPSIILCLTK